ncbi:winged helix-turn-helix domain-containing protein [Nitrincola sp.]|uniref:winged helix-turn-helix domain-containing protein n=1 Tax=Nitrincola sp. TaxID=1926584 RepID=UPI003A8ED057
MKLLLNERTAVSDLGEKKLTTPELNVLKLLIEHNGSPVSISEIQSNAWRGKAISKSSVLVAINKLRTSLSEISSTQDIEIISTIKDVNNESCYKLNKAAKIITCNPIKEFTANDYIKNLSTVRVEKNTLKAVSLALLFLLFVETIYLANYHGAIDSGEFVLFQKGNAYFFIDLAMYNHHQPEMNNLFNVDPTEIKQADLKNFFPLGKVFFLSYKSGIYIVDCVIDAKVQSVITDSVETITSLIENKTCEISQ